jgi:hypothetical protein
VEAVSERKEPAGVKDTISPFQFLLWELDLRCGVCGRPFCYLRARTTIAFWSAVKWLLLRASP